MEPTLGRIVLFRTRQEVRGQAVIPAMITMIEGDKVTISAFPPGGGTPSYEGVKQGDADTPFSWFWPPGSANAPATVAAPEGTTTQAPSGGAKAPEPAA